MIENMKPLKFKIFNRSYNLEFNHIRIMQIKGESATGKSLMVSDFLKYRSSDEQYRNSLVINSEHPEGLALIKEQCSYNYVIIDNADILLTDREIKLIQKNLWGFNKTYWIIIGRNFYPCVLSNGSIGVLVEKKINNIFCYEMDYTQGV